MNEFLLNLIVVIHILFILFIIITPFTNITVLLFEHAIIVPFIMLHWVTNNNMCALTMAEKYVRTQVYGECDAYNCFTCRLIEPVYDITNDKDDIFNIILYTVTIVLWLITMYKLYYLYQRGEITEIINECRKLFF